MSNTTTIILKNSGTTGNVPTSANMQFGELAINYADGLLFYKAANGTVLSISGSGGAIGNGQAAFDQANVATEIAVSAFTKANQQTNIAFKTVIANGTSLVADSNSDTLTILTSGNVSITADADGDNLTFDLTSTGVTSGTFGSTTSIPVITVDSKGRLTAVSTQAIDPSIASAAFDKANAQANLAFSTIIANGTSLVADSNADTLTIRTTGNVAITADTAGDNMTFDLTTTGVTAATYGSATIVPVLTVDARGRLTSVTNTTINVFAFGVVVANGTSLVADTSNDTLTIRTTGNVAITADASGDNMTFDLTTTGVTAATYGSGTIIPVLTVDARGRLTAVSNVTITGNSQAAFDQANSVYSNAVLKTGNTMTGQLVMAVGTSSVSQNTGSIIVNGGIGVSGNVYISNSSSYGFANTSNVSVAKIQYNAACNSIDFVFG